MFSKAKIRRFNEEVGCAPPPTKYDPKVDKKSSGCYLDRSLRFKENKEPTPFSCIGPNIDQITPIKKSKSSSIPKLNVSTSSTSSSSQSSFLTPLPFARSKSLRHPKSQNEKQSELKKMIENLLTEKKELQESVSDLESKLSKLRLEEIQSSQPEKKLSESTAVQVNLDVSDNINQSNPEDLSCHNRQNLNITAEELQLLRDQIDHLTMLRDNLESSLALKDDTISDLQMQIDLIVAEAEENQEELLVYKEELLTIRKMLGHSCDEKSLSDLHVRDLIARYETLVEQQHEERKATKDILAEKDIEIELMSDSIETLNTQISEYERSISRMHTEVKLRKTQISILESTVGDLSMTTKEKEVMETVLEDEIKEKNQEINELMDALSSVEEILKIRTKERDSLHKELEEEKLKAKDLNEKLEGLELGLREKEVVQQFLEKEVASREAEVSESSEKVVALEGELQGAKQRADDLQRLTEEHVDAVVGLRATLSVKVFDLEKKEDVIGTLQDQITSSNRAKEDLLKDLNEKSVLISRLEGDLISLKGSLSTEQENTSQLQERLIELMAQVADNDTDLKFKLCEKESELEELTVKYSESLMEQENSRRLLSSATESLEKEKLVLEATERELESMKEELSMQRQHSASLDASVKQLTHKLVHIEDALACEEAAANEAQEKLRKEVDASQRLVEILQKEKTAAQATTDGFAAQINELKLSMAKKAVAVEDMQARIDSFREEKTQITAASSRLHASLRDKEGLLQDLQNEFETRLHVISNLQSQLQEKENSVEEERETASQEKDNLQSSLETAQEALAKKIEDVTVMEERLRSLEGSLSTELEKERERSSRLNEEMEDLRKNYEQNISSIQVSLADKTSEALSFEQSSESYRDKVEELESNIECLKNETDQLNCSLSSKDQLLSNLNQSVCVKEDQIENLQNSLERKQQTMFSMEKRVVDLEKVIENIKSERDEEALQASAMKESMEKVKRDMELEGSVLQELEDLRVINGVLREDSDSWRNKFQYLEKMIEPFREQLDSYELEKAALLSQSQAAQEEVSKLSNEYAKLLGHNNNKQKIQHMVKLKTDNIHLREKISNLQLELEKQKKVVRRLEERLDAGVKRSKSTRVADKENAAADFPTLTSTPLRAANRYHRL